MARVVVVAKEDMAEVIAATVQAREVLRPRTGKAMRHALHKAQPALFIADEDGVDFELLPELVRVHYVTARPRIIAAMRAITRRKLRLAALAGVYDVINRDDELWPQDLQASVEAALGSPRSSGQQVLGARAGQPCSALYLVSKVRPKP